MIQSGLGLCVPRVSRLKAPSWHRAFCRIERLHPLCAHPSTFRTKVVYRCLHSDFRPFVPPTPSSLPKPASPKTYRRTRKCLKWLRNIAVGLGIAYGVDKYFLYSSLTRSARTFWLGCLVATDYKINFRPHPPLADSIQALHARNAERLFDLLRTNGGLYLKIGQAIAMQVNTRCLVNRRTRKLKRP